MTYTLQPGTIAHLCFKHLSTIAPGGEISTAELASAIGQPSSAMLPSTQAARNHGLIRARYRDGNQRHLWWSIGDGTPLEKPAVDDSEEDDGPLGKPFVQPPASMRSVFDLAQDIPVFTNTPPRKAATKAAQVAGKASDAEGHAEQRPPIDAAKTDRTPTEEPLTAVQTRVQAEATEACSGAGAVTPECTGLAFSPPDMRVAIWSDGAIQIRRGDNDVAVLSPSEAKQVVDALDLMLGRIEG